VFCGGESVDVASLAGRVSGPRGSGGPPVAAAETDSSAPPSRLATSGPDVPFPARWEIPPTLPLALGLTALAVCGILPPAVRLSGQPILALLACVLLAPLPPMAWITGLKYENRCRERSVPPEGMATAGKYLGVIATFLLLFEFAVFAILVIVGFRAA